MLSGKGFAIADEGGSFGGGNLLKYGIRSNIRANEFLNLMWKQNDETNGDYDILKSEAQMNSQGEQSEEDSSWQSQKGWINTQNSSETKDSSDSAMQKIHSLLNLNNSKFGK